MSEIDYAARVAKGAALLDKERPGWERLIDLEILDIENGYHCVTAQLSGTRTWWRGMRQLGLTEGDGGTYVAHGFNAESDHINGELVPDDYDQPAVFDTLNTLWKDLISKRLAPEPADG